MAGVSCSFLAPSRQLPGKPSRLFEIRGVSPAATIFGTIVALTDAGIVDLDTGGQKETHGSPGGHSTRDRTQNCAGGPQAAHAAPVSDHGSASRSSLPNHAGKATPVLGGQQAALRLADGGQHGYAAGGSGESWPTRDRVCGATGSGRVEADDKRPRGPSAERAAGGSSWFGGPRGVAGLLPAVVGVGLAPIHNAVGGAPT